MKDLETVPSGMPGLGKTFNKDILPALYSVKYQYNETMEEKKPSASYKLPKMKKKNHVNRDSQFSKYSSDSILEKVGWPTARHQTAIQMFWPLFSEAPMLLIFLCSRWFAWSQ